MKPLGLPLFSLLFVSIGACAQSDAAPSQAASSSPPATASAGCGRISVFDVAPRSEDIYRARLINLDGKLPGPTGARSYRTSAGRHVLEVAELIDNEQFNDVQLRQRVQQSRRYKTLELDVQPNTTYLLGARLVEARRNYVADGSYWEPVIYHQNSEACQ